jgi:hypothetical protein
MIRACDGWSKPFPDLAGARFAEARSASRMNNGVKISGRFSM